MQCVASVGIVTLSCYSKIDQISKLVQKKGKWISQLVTKWNMFPLHV